MHLISMGRAAKCKAEHRTVGAETAKKCQMAGLHAGAESYPLGLKIGLYDEFCLTGGGCARGKAAGSENTKFYILLR